MDDDISWEKVYKLGVEEIDSQHKFFIGLLQASMEAPDDADQQEALGYLLQRLLLYAEFHFKTEEGIMSRKQYPVLEQHKQIHEELLAEAERLYAEWTNGSFRKIQLVQFLWIWLRDHIGSVDRSFGEFLQETASE